MYCILNSTLFIVHEELIALMLRRYFEAFADIKKLVVHGAPTVSHENERACLLHETALGHNIRVEQDHRQV